MYDSLFPTLSPVKSFNKSRNDQYEKASFLLSNPMCFHSDGHENCQRGKRRRRGWRRTRYKCWRALLEPCFQLHASKYFFLFRSGGELWWSLKERSKLMSSLPAPPPSAVFLVFKLLPTHTGHLYLWGKRCEGAAPHLRRPGWLQVCLLQLLAERFDLSSCWSYGNTIWKTPHPKELQTTLEEVPDVTQHG